MESHRGGTGQLLHDLEEKMEVARVQLQILETMNRLVLMLVLKSITRV